MGPKGPKSLYGSPSPTQVDTSVPTLSGWVAEDQVSREVNHSLSLLIRCTQGGRLSGGVSGILIRILLILGLNAA